jgi:predicted Fe-Mo cluster-binding NifX family protein
MIVAVSVTADGMVTGGWGRADRVAIARVEGGKIEDWTVYETGWNSLHDEGTEGSHHARIARFLMDHKVERVVTGHMGPPMQRMLAQMGIAASMGGGGDARAAVLGQA